MKSGLDPISHDDERLPKGESALIDKQLDELKLTGALPSPTGVGLSILRLTQGDDYAMGEITRIIQSDPALTGRILKLANSAANAGRQPVASVGEAGMRLGVRTVRNISLGFTLVSGHGSGACREFDYQGYWASSLARAVAAQALATQLRVVPSVDAFTCALLCGIGRLALASIHPEKYATLLANAREQGLTDLIALEQEVFDLDHRQLASAMLRDWKLPESLASAVSTWELPEDRVAEEHLLDLESRGMTRVLRLAHRFAHSWLLREGAPEETRARELEALRADLEMEPAPFERLCTATYREWLEWGKLLEIPTSESAATEELLQRAEGVRDTPGERERPRVVSERTGLRILCVDDDSVSLRLLEHHLERDGHSVVSAMNGHQALRLALAESPQMVVTDWMMPKMDGIELCKALRSTEEGRGIYILLLTGREDEDRVVEAFQAGADEYVVKPFNPKLLLARVRAGQRMIELREQAVRDHHRAEKQKAEMAILNRMLSSAAMTDVLTKLNNRRYAMRRLEDEVASAQRVSSELSVIMIDIDHFKAVNDRHGHALGDVVLRETAVALKRETRRGDVVCRLGGEEFLVICPRSDLASCERTAERLRSAVEANRIAHGFDGSVTVSLGVASLACGANNFDELLKIADRRVYFAKAHGRNLVCASDDPGAQSRSA